MKTSRAKRGHRRLRRGLGIALAVGAVAVALWMLDHLRPRHAHFVERRGAIVAATVTDESATASRLINLSVHVRADTGLAVRLRVLRPRETESPLPLIVLLGGHRTGRHAVELVGDPGAVAVAALDYPYDGPEKIRGVLEGVTTLPRMQRALLDTPPAVSLTLDWLLEQPWVDAQRVELVGVSLGTPFAAVAGALDERFRRVWLIHGGARHREWLEHTLREKIGGDFLRGAAAALLHVLAHGASFKTADWVPRIAPRPVVVVGARHDESLSPDNIESLYAAAGDPRELRWTDGGHVKRHRPEVVRQLLAIVLDAL